MDTLDLIKRNYKGANSINDLARIIGVHPTTVSHIGVENKLQLKHFYKQKIQDKKKLDHFTYIYCLLKANKWIYVFKSYNKVYYYLLPNKDKFNLHNASKLNIKNNRDVFLITNNKINVLTEKNKHSIWSSTKYVNMLGQKIIIDDSGKAKSKIINDYEIIKIAEIKSPKKYILNEMIGEIKKWKQ